MYGITLVKKSGREVVLPLGNAHEIQNGQPVFAVWDADENASHLLTAQRIKRNWKAWAGALFANTKRLSKAEAKRRGVEIL